MRALLVALAVALAPAVAEAEASDTRVSLRHRDLPAPPVDGALATIDGRPVVLSPAGDFALDPARETWAPIAAERVVAVVSDGARSIALLGEADRIDGVALASLAGDRVALAPLPAPPPMTGARGALAGDTVYLAGDDAAFAALDLVHPAGWRALPAWPGDGSVIGLAAQRGSLWLTLGGARDRLLSWSSADGWRERAAPPGRLLPGAARPAGQAHVLYLTSAPPALVSYATITSSWATVAALDAAPLAAAPLGDGFLWRAGDRARVSELTSDQQLLGWLDWIVIAVYLVAMLGIGLYFYLRERRSSTSDFFVGGRSIPFWAAGVSLYAANTSSISYIAIPAKAFETNWQYLTNSIVVVVGLVFVARWVVPLLRRLDLMSVFSYLERRFHPSIRLLSSALFMTVQIGSRMSVILLLPSLAISTMTGIDVAWSIAIMGGFTMVYTALGGMKAVIWTDVVQLIVKMGGILFALGFIVYALDGGAGQLLASAAAEDKMKLLDFRFDLTQATVWGFVFLVLFDVVLTFPKDQVLMQRVLSTKNDKDAGRSVWTFAALMIPGGVLFYLVGTALFAFYQQYPERMNPLLPIDATFPLFIAAELPMGLRGLIIAGILAAAMATLSGIMNSVATLASVDFYEKVVRQPDPRVSVRFAEAMTIVTGLCGMGVALLLSRYDVHSLFDTSIELAGLLGGGFAGAYTLGMFTRRANWQGVALGVAVAIGVTLTARSVELVHPYFYLAISIAVCIVVGYVASLAFPAPRAEQLEGLTIRG